MKQSDTPRLLIVPGLHDSGPAHWQTWLEQRQPGALRVRQADWKRPALEAWAEQVDRTLDHAGGGPWIAAAHSFGCLALAQHLLQRPDTPLQAVLLVAPADPQKFGVDTLLDAPLPVAASWVASTNDPWMSFGSSLRWAERWGCGWTSLGAAGHINAEAGFGPLPLAARWVRAAGQKLQRRQRPVRAELREWSFSV
jgi:predicted alpha/beta hydrolase family esterase